MYHPPLLRKLLPWLYALLFLIIAPALIFYTSGYRYNLKKAAIEKYGTLITDSTPVGAAISLDGQATGNTTPSVFQEMTPGRHRIRLEKDRYFPWEKTLEVRPERVTFANTVHLWRMEPEIRLQFSGNVQTMTSNPDQDTLALLQTAPDASTHLVIVQSKGRISLDAPLTAIDPTKRHITWQADSRALALESANEKDTLVRFVGKGINTTTTLADGFWQEDAFVSFSSPLAWRWNSKNGEVLTDTMASSVREKVGDFVIQKATTSTQLLFDRTFSSRAFSLPAGQWQFNDVTSNTLLLRDGMRWLGVNPREDEPFLGFVEGDLPRWLTTPEGNTRALFVHNNELWQWNMGSQPELVVRESAPIREAVWHASGDAVFLASDTQIDVLELDTRDGRIRHPLATFEKINDIDLIGKILYVAGTRDGQTGLWSVTVE